MRFIIVTLITTLVLLYCTSLAFSDDFEEDFSNAKVGRKPGEGDWVVYDEPPKDLGDKGPSAWDIAKGLDGKALTQSSNIWGDATDAVAIGSFVIYDKAEWVDFSLEVDVVANDNDGMGIVWRWKDRLNHYRFITMFDSGNSPNGRKGPYRLLERRLGDGDADGNGESDGAELPFYETLADNKEAYTQGVPQTWKLEAIGDTFKFYVDGKLTLKAQDSTYKKGKIGFLVYAQSGVFFDNLRITDLWAVHPQNKLAITWASIKSVNGFIRFHQPSQRQNFREEGREMNSKISEDR
ncbi:TPA: DUF1080 domain-containing protein [Candidatus Poribacteria bacterium]|nr:DUF1080 domain-containing protein [Candidatus Poribacteria bacterium]